MSAGSKRGHATVRSAFPCTECERSFPSAGGLGIHRARKHGLYSQTPDAVRNKRDYDAMRVKVPGKGWEERGPGSTGGGGVVTVRSPFAGAVDIAAAPGEGHGSSPVSVRQGAPGDDRIPCADCTYRFVSEDALRRHRAFKHPEPAESHRAPIVGEVPDDPEPAMSAEFQGLDVDLGQAAEAERPPYRDLDADLSGYQRPGDPEPVPATGNAAIEITEVFVQRSMIESAHIRFMLQLLLQEAVVRSEFEELRRQDLCDVLLTVLAEGGFQLYLVPPGVTPSVVPALGAQRI